MESTGVPGAINVTESVFTELRGNYAFEERGLVEVKGRGKLPSWILRRQVVGATALPLAASN
jgi:hypothetical protein